MTGLIFENDDIKNKLESDCRAAIEAFIPGPIRVTSGREEMESPAVFCALEGDEVSFSRLGDRESESTAERPLRHAAKRCLYRLLSRACQRELPWGCLTGVRPVSLVAKRLRTDVHQDGVMRWFMDEYYVSEPKARLALDIALRQRDITAGMDGSDYSLYVGIPFCPTTCLYCSFTSYPIGAYRQLLEPYLQALYHEIRESAAIMGGRRPASLYIGGGTPGVLEAGDIEALMKCLDESFGTGACPEITFEAGRPDCITREKLEVLKAMGVSRISVNPQTMNGATLSYIGRHHTPEQIREAFCLAREAGFDDINMDLILGLPGEGEAELAHTLEEVKKLGPDCLTFHALAVKRGSALYERLVESAGALKGEQAGMTGGGIDLTGDSSGLSDMQITGRMQDMASQCAASLGMKPYYLYRQKRITDNFENVGWAGEGKYCIYNTVTMEEIQSVAALGAGSVSKRIYNDPARPGYIRRCDNVKDVKEYISRIDEMIARKKDLFGDQG